MVSSERRLSLLIFSLLLRVTAILYSPSVSPHNSCNICPYRPRQCYRLIGRKQAPARRENVLLCDERLSVGVVCMSNFGLSLEKTVDSLGQRRQEYHDV